MGDRKDCGNGSMHTSGPATKKAGLPNFVLERRTVKSDLAVAVDKDHWRQVTRRA